ncbi:hypothetical protein [Microbacterium sp. 13-71-7]|jgi:hypothetical protein|uniref:hypothetical protein n=1 Tax=Microbacterium sp. 13-71-7 TaxID=1970399 RepID=UPI000BD3DC10|nr:hypothetical protein [Microbacterium sp. 13-71-7]OZB83012.1 MAG: hypothetical protein B7X32_11770 [Microbacterium sp. 13-71-7]
MSTLWKRAVATTTIALVAGFGITACSSGGGSAPDSTQSSAEQQKQADKKPMTAGDFAQRVSDAMAAAKTAHVTQSMSMQGNEVASTGDVMMDADPKNLRMHLNMSVGAQKFEMFLVEGTIYMNMGAMTQDKFVKISADDNNPVAAQMQSMLSQSSAATQLKNASAAMKDFRAAGAEKVDGADTTHYVLTLDTEKLLAAQGAQAAQAAQIGDTITYDMYIDGKDLVRRAVMNMGTAKTTIDYTKWGEPVTIEAPAADQLTEMPGI